MKNLSLLDKLIAAVNSIFAVILLLSYSCYFISPNSISLISFLSLSIPFLILINFVFILYWLIKLKKQILISLVILLIGFPLLSKFYSFNNKKTFLSSDIKIMSYNVRMFNLYKWMAKENHIDKKIYRFIKDKNPDILCVQEYHHNKDLVDLFPYHYIKSSDKKNNFGDAIFSKYEILNSGSLNFTNTSNNVIFADIIKKKDTFRVYNVHLESYRINPKKETITQKNVESFKIRVEKAFKKQANQVTLLLNHQKETHYKSIICGDFNNTAFSWVYHQLNHHRKDAFEIAGNGFGSTYNFAFPMRIDFILADENMAVNNFKTYTVKYSDHYPIMARLNLKP
ncbi:MAG: endonuclease/exonuclease/phosphatase family protein [Lutibacter sp.]|uniref:endonuclease/exonuclease/phosphatase family protein n=1 Tax=Lutibacter sp. TaxID=1925666 RepID=UPI00299E3F9D|nr:endonuclease/exonuclease/phosphatase family protein [Lutibacter sp.]MDX1830207.1 endonuclease/exonuclease/phosphatase family protein [Lutibacter sp.]